MTTTPRAPVGLEARGKRLWREVLEEHALAAPERLILEEACRIADRLERLDGILRGSADEWLRLREVDGREELLVVVDAPLSEARQQANVLKQLLASLRLPDEASGAKPQRRGARGAYQPKGAAGGTAGVSSLDRARAARAGA